MSSKDRRPIAIVPAAGVGTRLRPHTHTVPKALVNVAGKPILAHILDGLVQQGIERVVVVVGYMGDAIRTYCDRRYAGMVEYIEQSDRLGLGHAVHLTRQAVEAGPILIILGDTIVLADYGDFMTGPHPVLGVKQVEDPERFGIAQIEGEFVTKLVEKPERFVGNLALVGIYYLPEARDLYGKLDHLISRDLRTKGEYQLTDALALMIEDGAKMKTVKVDGWFDCGKPETLLATNEYLLKLAPRTQEIPGVTLLHPVSIDPTATVTRSIIGPNVSIAGGAVVHNAIVHDTIINENAEVRDIVLESSLIGENAVVRGGGHRLNVGDSSEIDFSGKWE
ncbi:MAG: sugar phosphate nucleotidyltransferase [Candidatus Eisenbacteria bacterium]